jgi:hypothetical protein
MASIELHLDEATLARAKQLAAAKNESLDDLVADLIRREEGVAATTEGQGRGIAGSFADEPELLDQVAEEAMELRRLRWAQVDDERHGQSGP